MQPLKVLLLLVFVLPFALKAQHTIEPYIGYSIDMRNKQPLSQFTIGLQYPILNKPVYQMIVAVRAGLPLNKNNASDTAYTVDPSLSLSRETPLHSRLYSYSFQFMHRIKVVSWKKKNSISAFANVGISYQKIKVSHLQYNADKYTLLNPHRTLEKTGIFLGAGAQYNRQIGEHQLFVQATFWSPPIVTEKNESFRTAAPFSINLGYAITLNNKKK